MNERPEPQNNDARALRYLDALDAGDLDTVAAIWHEAGSDPALGHALLEIDNALIAERTLLPMATPAAPPWNRVAAATTAIAIAASLVLAMYLRREAPEDVLPQSPSRAIAQAHAVTSVSPEAPPAQPSTLAARRWIEPEPIAFNWPFDNTLSMSTPLDSLN